MSAHHLNVNRASCRGATSGRRAGFRCWSLTFIILVTTIHARAHSIVDTEPSIAETVDVLAKVPKSHVPARKCGAARAQRLWRSGIGVC